MPGKRRWLLGTISGFCFGLFLGFTLLGFGVVRLDSPALTILPIAGLLVGLGGSLWAPRGDHSPREQVTVAPRAQGFAPPPADEQPSEPPTT